MRSNSDTLDVTQSSFLTLTVLERYCLNPRVLTQNNPSNIQVCPEVCPTWAVRVPPPEALEEPDLPSRKWIKYKTKRIRGISFISQKYLGIFRSQLNYNMNKQVS